MTDLSMVKGRQQQMWASGDYAAVGTPLHVVAESLCEAADLRAGWRVLDVATGSGNAAIAAARRHCQVTGIDYVPALLERGRERAAAERMDIRFLEGDAEDLPFGDGEFDAAVSTFGVMFAPQQERAARELLRVCRPGGRIALASWTREGLVGELFATTGKFNPPPQGVASPLAWGSEEGLARLFPGKKMQLARRHFVLRYLSAEDWLEFFRSRFGPMLATFEVLDPAGQRSYERALLELVRAANRSGDKTLVAPAEYLEAIITV
jgi:SAM-dependent methyltransferase